MALSPHDVADLARLARIELIDDELELLAPQLDVILESVAHAAGLPVRGMGAAGMTRSRP